MPRSLFLTLALSFPVPACGDDSDGGSGTTSEGTTSGGSTSAGTGSGSSGAAAVDFDTEIQPILNANCLCHMQGGDGTMEADYLTMNPGMAVANLVDVPAMGAADIVRVAPADRDGSYLWHKLNGTHPTVFGVGDAMPPLGPLADDEIALIGAWIDGL